MRAVLFINQRWHCAAAIRLVFAIAWISCTVVATANDAAWIFNGNGNWNEPVKWSNGVPNDDSLSVTIDDGDSATTVTLNESVNIGNLLVGANDSLRIVSNSNVAAALSVAQSVSNDGTVSLSSGFPGDAANLSIVQGAFANNATGVLHFQIGSNVRNFSGDLSNDGIVYVDSPFTTFDKFDGHYVNRGEFTVFYTGGIAINDGIFNQNAGILDVDGQLTFGNMSGISNGGVFQQMGGTTIVTGLFTSSNTAQFLGGQLLGSGVIAAPVEVVGAMVEPGEGVGTLTISHNYIQQSGGTLIVELGGPNAGEYDVLNVAGSSSFPNPPGTATLGGTLDVRLVDIGAGEFSPALGQSFAVLAAASGIIGTFDNHQLPSLDGGLDWRVDYHDNRVSLMVVPEVSSLGLFLAGIMLLGRARPRRTVGNSRGH